MNESFNFGLSQITESLRSTICARPRIFYADTRAASGRFISAVAGWEGNKNRGAGLAAAAAAAAVQRAGGVNLKGHQPASHNGGGR